MKTEKRRKGQSLKLLLSYHDYITYITSQNTEEPCRWPRVSQQLVQKEDLRGNRSNRCSKRILRALPSTYTQVHVDEMIIKSTFNYHKKIITTTLTIVEEELPLKNLKLLLEMQPQK